jgi:SnoaL-like domain
MASQLERYLDAWVLHCLADGPEGGDARERLVACTTEDVRCEDVPSGAVFDAHEGIVEICTQGHQMSADLAYEIVGGVTDGGSYAFESVGKGTNTAVGPIPATGRSFVLRVVSVEFSDGLVCSHRDYWDLAGLLAQLGVMPPARTV